MQSGMTYACLTCRFPMTLTSTVTQGAPASQHIVQFYERDEFLYGRVADFIAAGVMAGEAAVVIAVDEHRRGIAAALAIRGIDAAAVTFADANATLAAFMRDGAPDARLFRATMRQVVG